MGEACRKHGEVRNANRMLVGKREGKKPIGRHRPRWEDNIKIALKDMGWEWCTRFIWLRIGTGGRLLLTL
jgi:hypothetical protein